MMLNSHMAMMASATGTCGDAHVSLGAPTPRGLGAGERSSSSLSMQGQEFGQSAGSGYDVGLAQPTDLTA